VLGRDGHRTGTRPRLAQVKDQTVDLGTALAAFIAEHEYCGELAGIVEDDLVTLTCTCGGRIVRPLEDLGK
jgi:hypothetical protein